MDNLELTEEVLKAYQNGDKTAFLQIYNSLRDYVYIVSYRILRDEQAAEDVTMSIFFTLWERRSVNYHLRSFVSFVFIITRHNSLTALRANKRRYKMYEKYRKELVGTSDDMEEVLRAENELALKEDEVFSALDKLPQQTREIFLLRYYNGLKAADVAVKMGITTKAVYNQCQQASEMMRKLLGDKWLQTTLATLSILYTVN